MAFKVKFNGVDLMNDGEGNFAFSRGTFAPFSKAFEPMARAESLLSRELATEGAEHRVLLKFKAMDPDTVSARLLQAFESGEGTLEIRGRNDVPNCEMSQPPPVGEGRYSVRYDGTEKIEGQEFVVSCAFIQLEA